jgi:hypothetical protein
MPEHVHLVLARHTCKAEQIVNLLKGEATRSLLASDVHPLANYRTSPGKVPKCWGENQWVVFLDTDEAIRRAIRYVEDNPLKEGLPRQRWSFVTQYGTPALT